MNDKPKLSESEQRATEELKQDAIRLTKRNDTILLVIARLEEALRENKKYARQIEIWLDQYAELATENKELKDEIIELRREIQSLG